MQEQQGYGAYTGNQSYQAYNDGPLSTHVPPTLPQNDMYDDAFIDALSLRLSQRMAQGPVGKLKTQDKTLGRATAGQRLALAIVSLVFFTGILFGLLGNTSISHFVAFISIGVAAFVFVAVNFLFNRFA